MTEKLLAMRAAEEVSAGKSLDSYPLRLYAHHMAEIFGVSINQVYELDASGNFVQFENRPRIGRKTWSRDRVKAYFDGDQRRASFVTGTGREHVQ